MVKKTLMCQENNSPTTTVFFRMHLHVNFVRMNLITCLWILYLPCAMAKLFDLTSGDDCHIRLDVEFSAQVTAKYHGRVVKKKVITEHYIDEVNVKCVWRENLITLFSDKLEFKFSFEIDSSPEHSTVTLNPEVDFEPQHQFPELENQDGFLCFQGPSKKLGDSQSSYLCPHAEKMHYPKKTCDVTLTHFPASKHKYSVELNMKKIHAQAWNIKSDEFSPHVVCKQPRNSAGVIAGSVVAVIAVIAIVVVVVVLVIRRRRKSSPPENNVQTPDANERSSLLPPSEESPQVNQSP